MCIYHTLPYLSIFFDRLVHRCGTPHKVTPWSKKTIQFQKQHATYNRFTHFSSTTRTLKIETLSSENEYKFKEKKSVGEINNHLHAKVHDNVRNE